MRVLSIEELGEVMVRVMQFMSFSGKISWAELAVDFEQVFTPMLIGGMVLGSVAWVVSFLLTLSAVKGWRAHREKRLKRVEEIPARRN